MARDMDLPPQDGLRGDAQVVGEGSVGEEHRGVLVGAEDAEAVGDLLLIGCRGGLGVVIGRSRRKSVGCGSIDTRYTKK